MRGGEVQMVEVEAEVEVETEAEVEEAEVEEGGGGGGGPPCRQEVTTAVRRGVSRYRVRTTRKRHGAQTAYRTIEPWGWRPCASGTQEAPYAWSARTARRRRDVRVSIALHMLGQRGKVVGEELGRVVGLGSEQRLEAVRVELGHALARDVRRHPLVGAEPARRLDIEGHHAA